MPANALSEPEALLRVALLVSRADGNQSPEEMVVMAETIGTRLISPTVAKVQLWRASQEITTTPAKEVLREVRRALADSRGRERAFEVACEVAKADKRLSWDETKQMIQVAKALGLKKQDVQRIAATYWH